VRFLTLAAALLLMVASRAAAHPAPFSYLDLHLRDSLVEGSLTLHVIDVAHDLGMARAPDLLDPAVVQRERARVIRLVSSRLSIRSGSEWLALNWGTLEPTPDRDAVRLLFRAAAATGGSIVVRARLFEYDPLHQTFLNVYEHGSLRQQMIFNAGEAERTYYRGTAQGTLAVVATFVPSGIHHILIGPDHILFLVGLLLLGGGGWALVRIVTAFTIGHSITLSLAALDVITPPPTLIEPAIALSIVFVGADNLLVGTRGRDVRAWIALAFGLVHGFGFAYVLKEFGLPREALAWSLFSFNVGVEIGQLMIVLAIAGVLAFVRQRDQAIARRVAFAGSVVVMAAGAYWFVERVFFTGGV
jgi:hydrogenase/urease accessory protein HupE